MRGVQVHGDAAERAVAGQRTAVNLADIEPAELARGDVLSEPGRFRAVTHVDCRLQLLPSAKPLKHRAPVHFHSGTAEIGAEVRLLGGATVLQPGGAAFARLVLKRAGAAVARRPLHRPHVLAGGDHRRRRWCSTSPPTLRSAGAAERLAVLAAVRAPARIALLVRESEFGAGMKELVARTGWREAEIAAAAASCVAHRSGRFLVRGRRVVPVRARQTDGGGAGLSSREPAGVWNPETGPARP